MYNQIKLTRQNIHNIEYTYTEQLTSKTTDISFNKFSVINDEEIIKAIKALKDDSSPRLERILVKIFKLNIHSLVKPLSHIFNLAVAISTFLERFKMSLCENNLFLNLEKTYTLPHYIVNSNQPNKTNLCIHENDCLNQNMCTCQTFVKVVKNCKYLGIVMCHYLKWKDHIKYITNKLRKLMYAFKILTDILELQTIRVVYQSLIESI
ncbi:hypothetical protein AGLY_006356 [Aphis glycines]|uniref:Uncharacterized protein n=1 Tax=Aphis glycines TaxID=307491 RepID=A0A6G0TR07_APHGL|nr:hypothetical protein AGLY_006356 [Aphis glycines]